MRECRRARNAWLVWEKRHRASRDFRSCSWPSAQIAVMGAGGAVEILYRKGTPAQQAQRALEYTELFANPLRAAERGFIDAVINPKDTRRLLCEDLEVLRGKKYVGLTKKHGCIPL